MGLLVITQKVDQNDQLLGFFIDWLKRFAEKFEKVTVLCLEKGEFNLPQNIEVLSLGKDKGYSKIRQLYTFYFKLYTLRNDYDAVFVHMNPIWVVMGSLPWRLMTKKIYFWYTHKAVTIKLRLAEKMADVIFTASKESFRLPSEKIIVTGHGIDTDLFSPNLTRSNLKEGVLRFDLEGIKILSVGRIAPVKNYETLIEAAEILKNKSVDFKITMIGEAPLMEDKKYEENLKFKIKNLKLEENFQFIGKVNHEDLPQYYRSNDIFIHLSKTGSLDKTILEAMACGMKVLSSNDASRSFLPQNLIFDDENSQELANRILELKDSDFNQDLRQYVVQNHNLDNLIDKMSSTMNLGVS